jgi:hypothetical protein
MRWIPVLLTGSMLFGAAAEPAPAQESAGSRSALLRRAFREVGARHRLSTGKVEVQKKVPVRVGNRTRTRTKWVPAGYATVVSDEGHLLGVSEQLPNGAPIRIFLASENPYTARVSRRSISPIPIAAPPAWANGPSPSGSSRRRWTSAPFRRSAAR